jgi:predicted solute-binding protein
MNHRDTENAEDLRIGSVPYLNARPLIYGLNGCVTLCEPAELADRLRRGEFDAGMVPVAEVLSHGRYDVVDGVAIASNGPVRSVFLAHREPLAKLKRVAVTPVSRTSVWLLRVLLKQVHGIEPEFYPKPAGALLCDHQAMLLIGDEALHYSLKPASKSRGIWDLGEAWQKLTGLPFVYAVWALRRPVATGMSLPRVLRKAKEEGLAHLEEIVQAGELGTAEFRREYYEKCVSFDFGEREKAGLMKFQQYLKDAGLIEECHELRFA